MGKLRFVTTLMKEFLMFARQHKVYWIVPLTVVLFVMVGAIAVGQGAAPFIYTLF